MARFFLALAGVVLLAVTALALIWVLGQVLVGVGAFVVGAAGVLSRLLWFLVFTGVLAGLVYFVSSAWRPAVRVAPAAQKTLTPAPVNPVVQAPAQVAEAPGPVKVEG